MGPGSNLGRLDLQSDTLPTVLSVPVCQVCSSIFKHSCANPRHLSVHFQIIMYTVFFFSGACYTYRGLSGVQFTFISLLNPNVTFLSLVHIKITDTGQASILFLDSLVVHCNV